MADAVRVGIIGAGWPGGAHARGFVAAGGYQIRAVADLIPERRKKLIEEFSIEREFSDARDLLADPDLDAVALCLPNHLHAPIAVAALRAGKHVLCEKPPALNAREAGQMDRAAQKAGKVLLYALQRRFGPHAQAAKQAILRGFIGEPYHVRATWTRTRGIPRGTGWFTQKDKAGGGALIDIGIHMLDLAWHLLGQPKPASAYGIATRRFHDLVAPTSTHDVDDSAFALLRLDGGRSIELAASWAINQPPSQDGAVCRVYGDRGAVEVYTPHGAVVYRHFTPDGKCRTNPLKPPRMVLHTALARHFRACILGQATPQPGGKEGFALMQMVDAIYRSSESGRSVAI